MEVREEVSNEMADMLRSMEASYQVRPLGGPNRKIEGHAIMGSWA